MRLVQSALTALAVGAATVALASPTGAETPRPPDQVVGFAHEATPLTVWENPRGCQTLPVGTDLIFNQTERTITIYADPLCLVPIEPFGRVRPGFGTHVSAAGSFRA
ncbi:hypothetical protein [Crossiella sp. CA198]|uniref:hypothetical protein n=1 Tax=Crossiella sp. CA198 TaxID=3455607 RepID=UPI003F8D7A26